jgi:rod shape-determining protein MreD
MISSQTMAPQELLLPAKPGFILLTLFIALTLNLMPWPNWINWLLPDFVALLVLYWSIEAPRKMSFILAWCLGLMMDIANGSLFGQHALAYVILVYAGIAVHRRIQNFQIPAQLLHIAPLLLLTNCVVLLVRALADASYPGYSYFLSTLVGVALWPVIGFILKIPQRPRSDPSRA